MRAWTTDATGLRKKTLQLGNVTVNIHRPQLSEKQTAKQAESVKRAMLNLVRAEKEKE